ncbi:D-alanyl-D-alanine carboxypeptidase [Metallumcola ferriviriculae]|uniref:D-alanyl-D-alanine carboxypeptidase n=1 Tax=Metallumcola ferriviriculae TaxID=3039180 RepID=A0AAU0ULT8_9FIRM|nr:D-alanyl-D-alanine carboxypeptidase [Desulfitibacteraceae bacterium MK1]
MLRKVIFSFLLSCVLLANPQPLWGKPSITATNAVLIEAESGKILYNKDAFQPKPPASTTKILTALLALELTNAEDIVTVSENAASTGEASIHLIAGEKLTVEQLTKGAMIKSGNDAAVALAEHVAGNVELFSLLMNQKARLLGASHSNFVNPNGLPDERHLSTAYDLAVIAKYALSKKMFADVVDEKHETIPFNGQGKRYLRNTNQLLWKYAGANGVKTGTTRAAGSCLVASAKRNNLQLVSVVLKSGDRYGDSIRLLDYGFENFAVQYIPKHTVWGQVSIVDNEGTKTIPAKTAKPLVLVYPSSQSNLVERRLELDRTASPFDQYLQVGKLSLYIDKEKKASVPLMISLPAS